MPTRDTCAVRPEPVDPRGTMTDDAIQIREFREEDLDAVVAFSLRAWEPVFESLREVLGDKIFLRLHPDWRSNQAEAVKSSCLNEQRDVFVAVADGKPVGFAAVALNAFHEEIGRASCRERV